MRIFISRVTRIFTFPCFAFDFVITLQEGWLSVRQGGDIGICLGEKEGIREKAEGIREAEAEGRG